MKLENNIRNFIALIINFFYPIKKINKDDILYDWNNNKIKKILIIRQNQGLGDLLLFTPVLKAIKQTKPNVIIDFLASSYNYSVIQTNKNIRNLYIWYKSNFFKSIKLILKMRKENYDMIIVVSSHTPSFTSFFYARLANSKRVIGYDSFPFYNGALWSKYFANLELKTPEKDISEIKKFSLLIEPLKIDVEEETEFFVTEDAIRKMKEKYISLSKPMVGIFLGGNSKRTDRMWSLENWANLFNEFEKKNISTIAIIPPVNLKDGGGNKEEILYDGVCRILKRKIKYFSDYNIVNISAFIKNLKLFICPDGGIFHISVASKVNTIGLFIKTDSKRWAPKVNWCIPIQSKDSTPEGIKVIDVIEKSTHFLQ